MTTTLLTTSDAAARAGVKRGTILAWIRRGYLEGHRFGKAWQLDPADVDLCAAGRKVGWPKGRARKVQ